LASPQLMSWLILIFSDTWAIISLRRLWRCLF